MSAETSLEHNSGYLACLNDLKIFSETNVNINDYKILRDKFIVPKIVEYNENIGKILDDMYEAYNKTKP